MRNEREINRIEKSLNRQYLSNILGYHRKRILAARISVILAFVVSAVTMLQMMHPAESLARELVCGIEESAGHIHDESCYDESNNLICGMQEGEGAHSHTDECYDTLRVHIYDEPDLQGYYAESPGPEQPAETDYVFEPEQPAETGYEFESGQPAETGFYGESVNYDYPEMWENVPESMLVTQAVNETGEECGFAISYSEDAFNKIPDFMAVALESGSGQYADYEERAMDAVRNYVGDGSEMQLLGIYDLSVYDEYGTQQQPTGPVSISADLEALINLPQEDGIVYQYGDVYAVHFADLAEARSYVLPDAGLSLQALGTRSFALVGYSGEDGAPYSAAASDNGVQVLDTTVLKNSVSFETESFSIYAIVGTIIEKRILASDGNAYRVTVTYGADAGLPSGAQLDVREIVQEQEATDGATEYEEYVSRTEEALGLEAGSVSYVRLFDISIVDEFGEKIQPAEGSLVSVVIRLDDKEESPETQVVHFPEEEEEPEILEVQAVEDTVSFETGGFSVYAIVDAPEPVPESGWNKVGSVEEIAQRGGTGLYMRNPSGFYFTNKQYTVSGTRTGILKTPKASDADSTDGGAVLYYFDLVDGTQDQFLVYCYDGDEKRYIRQSANSLSLTDEGSADVFTISAFPNTENTFRALGTDDYYWNMQGGDNGKGFAAYNNATDTNARIQLEFYSMQEDDPYDLNGKTFGIAYHNDTAAAGALMAEVKDASHLAAKDMLMQPDVLSNDGILLVAANAEITEWTFENVSGDNYYITAVVDGAVKYLTIGKQSLTLADAPSDGSLIQVRPGTGENSGKYRLINDGNLVELNLDGNNTGKGYWSTTSKQAASWLNFVERSVLNDDDFNLYSAKKVSVSDTDNVYNGQQVIIYTRVWNDTTKRYEFYAVDHDGSLVRCYDAGDTVEWIGSKVNTALWSFTEYTGTDGQPNNYYELQNAQYGNYIAPQITGGQILSDSTIGINLNGRRYGENYTTIIAWDDAHYEYVGLKAENGRVVACPLSEADDFYFAIVNPVDETDELTTVRTVDNSQYGITMRMIDFNNPLKNERDSVQHGFFGAHPGSGTNPERGLLSTNLVDGYPWTTPSTGHEAPLSDLFSGMSDVNHLFIESIYNESGYFEYNSTSNFAHLNDDGSFTVYDQIAAIGQPTGKTRVHGQFMPYNTIEAGRYAYNGAGQLITNTTDVMGNELSDTDPRKGEKLYLIPQKDADYFFGMEMSASFTQTENGLDAWGHDIIFEFSGDDDFWLYVDDELVLDLGGVRSALQGSVNFRTGEVVSAGDRSTLYEVFRSNYRARGLSENEISQKLGEIFTLSAEGNYVFKDYSNHTMKMFYMERGAGASNLHMRFNLAAVKPGSFMLRKKLSGAEMPDNDLIEFPYQIYYYTQDDGESRPHLLDNSSVVIYEGTNQNVKFAQSYTPAGGTASYDNVFFLKPGESAEVEMPENATQYFVVECGVKDAVYDRVRANSIDLTGTATANPGRSDFATSAETLADRASVEYDNHVRDGAFRTLSFTKKLYAENGADILAYPEDPTLFSFRLYLGDEGTTFENLPAADMYSYHVKGPDGNYSRWDSDSQTFVSLGKSVYRDLTAEERKAATFTTSMNGSISKIPADHTVEIRDLIIDTKYKVEEREAEIPKGYTLRLEDGYTRVDLIPEEMNGTVPIEGTLSLDEDPEIEIRNQKGWGLTVEKLWSDKDFMEIHGPVYFAVYYKDERGNPGELVADSLRRLDSPESSVYYFFDHLDPGRRFGDYVIREVTIPVEDEQAIIEYTDGTLSGYDPSHIIPIEEGGTLETGGKPTGGEYRPDGYIYDVHYDPGQQTLQNENVRIDRVTNSRPGIELYKTDWAGANLAGAVFTLTDDYTGMPVAASSYTTGEDGLITTAYLSQGSYTLTETAVPRGYAAMDAPMVITVGEDYGITVSGVDESFYTISNENTAMAATITIRNRTAVLEAVKVDAATGERIADVHFALYRQVKDNQGNKVKDYLPITGYEDIATDENGVIDKLTQELPAGTYYLTETKAAPGYEKLKSDLCFTIGADGKVSVEGAEYKSWLREENDAENVVIRYTLTIPNGKQKNIRILKTGSDTGRALKDAAFSLYAEDAYDSAAGMLKAEAVPILTGVTGDDGILVLGSLSLGTYYLIETKAPAGYNGLTAPIAIHLLDTPDAAKAVTAIGEGGRQAEVTYYADDDLYEIGVVNNPGVELPATGGPGSAGFRLIGILLMAAGAGLLFFRKPAGGQ